MARKTKKLTFVCMYAIPESDYGDYCYGCAEGFGLDLDTLPKRQAHVTEVCGGCERTVYFVEADNAERWFSKGEQP